MGHVGGFTSRSNTNSDQTFNAVWGAASLPEISFQDERLMVGERADYVQAFPSPSKRGGKRSGAGRPRGSCRGGGFKGGRGGGGGSGGVGGAGGVVA